MFRDAPKFLQRILAGIIGNVGEEPFIQLSVRQFVWGYDEPLFKWLNEKFPDLGLPEEFSEEFGFLLGVRTMCVVVLLLFLLFSC